MIHQVDISETESRALDAYVKLLRCTDSLRARLDRRRTSADLTPTQFGVLEMLLHLGPVPQKTIGEKLLTSKSNVVALVDQLEAKDLVRRQRDAADRRRCLIHLTASGEAKIASLFPGHAAAIAEIFSPLTAREIKRLAALCRKLGLAEDPGFVAAAAPEKRKAGPAADQPVPSLDTTTEPEPARARRARGTQRSDWQNWDA